MAETIPPNPHPEQVEAALSKALCLLDTLAGEGLCHVYGNGQTICADTVCSETARAFGVDLEPGWYREVGRLASLANRPAGDVCDVCNGHGFWETAPGTCNPGGERIPCGKCSNITVTIGGQTWSGTAASIGTTIGSAGAKNNRPQTANRPADDGEPREIIQGLLDLTPIGWSINPKEKAAVLRARGYLAALPAQPDGMKRP